LIKRITWQDKELRNKVIDLVTRGSSENKRKLIEYSTIDISNDSAYIWVEKEAITPPIKSITEVECNIDVGSDNRVIGVEILGWPQEFLEKERQ
jgi:hypothetical protein